MPIDRVEIKSFKSIVDQTVDLGQLNVFIGTNGSGKSNFLESLGMLSCAFDGEINYSNLAEKGIRLSSPEVFKASFRNVRRKNTFSIEAIMSGMSYHANISTSTDTGFEFSAEKFTSSMGGAGRSNRGQTIDYDDSPDLDVRKKLKRSDGILPLAHLLGQFTLEEEEIFQDISDYGIYSLSSPILRGVSPDGSHKEPLGLYGGSLAVALSEVIKIAHRTKDSDLSRFFRLLNWFKSIGTTDEISSELQSSHVHTSNRVVQYEDKYMRRNFNKLYAYDVSEGALYILFVLVLLLHEKSPNIFALDNVDNALNPGLVRSLIQHVSELLEKNPRKQIFITTHNPTTLDSIDLFNENHRLFVVQRNDEGHTEINRVEAPKGFTKDEWINKHKGMRLSEIWLSGLIGGLTKQEF